MKITAAVLRAPDGEYALEEVDLAAPGPDQVLVRVVGAGMCHTDVLPRSPESFSSPPIITGHEGVGPSGYGAYHGRWGLEQFSHRKAVLERPTWFEMPVLYPPYRGWKERIAGRLF